MSERDHRIDLCRPSCRYVAGDKRDTAQEQCQRSVRDRVSRRYAKQQALKQTRQSKSAGQPNPNPGQGETHSLLENPRSDVLTSRAKREPNSNLASSLVD